MQESEHAENTLLFPPKPHEKKLGLYNNAIHLCDHEDN